MEFSRNRVWMLAGACVLGAGFFANGQPERRGAGPGDGAARAGEEFTREFFLERCTFVPHGRNAFFSLDPCYELYLAGDDGGEFVELYVTVLDETYDVFVELDDEVERVETRVIEEREYKDGELFEVSRNYFARCEETNDIFYFGEFVCFYKDGECVGHDGSWEAGRDGAEPGVIMPGSFLLGSRYFQEIAPGVAMDRAEHLEMEVTVHVPAGRFEDCVLIEETTPLEPGSSSEKVYAPGIGLVFDGDLPLVRFGYWGGCGGECPSDFNGDGRLNIFDFLAFQRAFGSDEDDADFNDDGQLNIFDFLEFQSAYEEGC